MLKIWGRTSSINVQKVMWTVAELGLPHERIDVGGPFGGLDRPDYAALNPNRLIPVLQDGATVVWESNAIVRYLAARYGAGSLWPEHPGRRSEADRWMDWQLTTLQPSIGPIFLGLIRTPPEQRDTAAIAASADRLGHAMRSSTATWRASLSLPATSSPWATSRSVVSAGATPTWTWPGPTCPTSRPTASVSSSALATARR